MNESRREFLKAGAKSVAVAAVAENLGKLAFAQKKARPSDRVRVGIVGLRARGESHIKGYAALPNVEIAALCDIDDKVLSDHADRVRKLGHSPQIYKDIRKLLDDKSIDAISIATPHHWHALMTIWACQAGKDVYVEKPCSHNLWEGGQMVRAAAKYNRIVQHGTQTRSNAGVMDAIKKIREEQLLGDVYLSRGLCFKWRDTIGHTPVSPVPAGVDYDLWTGPAPLLPFTKNHFHYNWHWFWNYGNGDLGNQGIHQLDVARWGLGLGFPNKISAIGGHVMFDDDQETPNTLNCAFEYTRPNKKPVILEFEVRHWITNHEAGIGAARPANAAAATSVHGGLGPAEGNYNSVGNIFYGPKGYLAIDNVTGYESYLGREQSSGPSGPDGPEDHFANFISCVVSRKKEDLRAPIEEGHITSGLAHLANASYRLGRTLILNPATELVEKDDEANHLLRDGDRGYRAPFAVPEQI
ncbi:MAG: oxidoreductase domain protein [Edaphobacter sp.]|nr:oxidoreductase domain protein [Edaphobacter sp.]